MNTLQSRKTYHPTLRIETAKAMGDALAGLTHLVETLESEKP